jgi:urate oxidase
MSFVHRLCLAFDKYHCSDTIMTELGDNYHGKERVRVAKVRRRPDGVQELVELRVRIELRGGTAASFTAGDNAGVVATDTCKNHVYMLAKTHPCSPPEHFAMDLARTFLQHYDHVNMASIRVEVEPWKRVSGRAGACIVILREIELEVWRGASAVLP